MYKRKNNGLILGILFICLLSLSIGLAALSTTLNINASSTINASSWDIHFNSITQTGGSTGVTGNPGNIVGGTSIENLQAILPLRGTYIEFTAEIHNEGDFPAFLNYYNLNTNLTCSGGTETENKNVCDYITVTVTGVGSGDLATYPRMNGSLYNEPLAVNATRQIKIRVDYDKNNQITADKLVNKAITINNINLTIQYSYGTGTQSDADIANAIKTSSIGSIVTLNNTNGKKIDSFTLYGNTSQGDNPTPDNSQEINVVTGTNTIKISGKNIVPTNYSEWESGQYAQADGSKQEYGGRIRVSTLKPVIPGKTYYFNTNSSNYNFVIRGYDLNQNFVKSFGSLENYITYLIPDNIYYLGIAIFNPNNNSAIDYETLFANGTIKPFICLDSELDKTYEPYKGLTTYNLNLGSIELAKIGDAQDSITYENGKWYLNKQVGKVVLDGIDEWEINSQGLYFQQAKTDTIPVHTRINPNMITTIGINSYSVLDNKTGFGLAYAYRYRINLSNINAYDGGTLQQFKTWLQANPITSYYQLATPTKTEITDTNVVNSLNGIKNINTLVGTTTIGISGTNINPSIQVKY